MSNPTAFCPKCGAPTEQRIPEGDNKERPVCTSCGYVNYINPSTVAGAVCYWEGKILLCKRAIDPRKGFWTLPAGFLELEETVEEGAIRETLEEACATISLRRLIALYGIPQISQTQVFFLADLVSPDIAAGDESLEVGLFDWDEIPWDELAFPTVKWALHQARACLQDEKHPVELRMKRFDGFKSYKT